MTVAHKVFDVRYDDSQVRFFDHKLREIKATSLVVMTCSLDQAEACKGIRSVKLKNTTLIADPQNLRGTDEGSCYKWFVKSSALVKESLVMNDTWSPAFVRLNAGLLERSNMDVNTNLIVVPDMRTCLTLKASGEYNGFLVLPLLKTITHLFPIHAGRSLEKVCIMVHGGYENWMRDSFRVMSYLFEKFKTTLNDLSQREACAISELHSCFFENTFKTSLHQNPYHRVTSGSEVSIVCLERMHMFVKSAFICTETFGDIPWYIASEADTEKLRAEKPVLNGVFAFVKENSKLVPRGESIFYDRVIILPKMEIAGVAYEYGSMIGTLGSCFDFRGCLFEDMSIKEEVMIGFLVNEFNNNGLSRETDAIQAFKHVPLPTECRTELVEKLKNILLKR